ncbi:MAG: ribokinase, partial [Candidatus Dormibacteraeota bacterium]|nr:ribokinase [Candidatus Dormibacteraeota bacterium]
MTRPGHPARVVVLGSLNRDYVVQVPRLPSAGQTVVGGGHLQLFSGGKGANQAVAAARLGAEVAMVGRVGDDDAGRVLVEGLEADGVDISGVAVDPAAPTGAALIVVEEGGQNLITVAPGANAAVGRKELELALGSLRAGDLLLLQLEIPMAAVRAAIGRAGAAGARVILNAAPAAKLDPEVLRGLDVLVVNETEARALAGAPAQEAAGLLVRRGPAAVVVTLGERGSLLQEGGRATEVAPHRVRAIDATGAGDAFAGGLAAALAAG